MNTENREFGAAFRSAHSLEQSGKLAEAESAYLALANDAVGRESVLCALANLYIKSGQLQKAAETLFLLTNEVPDNATYYWDLASVLEAGGNPSGAIQQFKRLTERQPSSASAQFNLAILCKRAFRYHEAIAAYERAIELGIGNAEEVWSNLGVLYSEMRDADNAQAMYERALSVDADYVPALLNLAGLNEERGDRDQAKADYQRILDKNPKHWDALARLAQTEKVTSADDPLVGKVEQAISQTGNEPEAREQLYFVLGKILDSVGDYAAAYKAYMAGNAVGAGRHAPYDAAATQAGFQQLKTRFSPEWISEHRCDTNDSPVFIVGMFRSGSTLVEQMLGAHPDMTAAGELDFLPWLVARELSPYPQRLADCDTAKLSRLAGEYIALTRDLFPSAQRISDKRPDNFLHLGLLRAMFPKARFIHTCRNRADNCLSILFQQLGNLAYATDLSSAADYYDRHSDLMAYWKDAFGEQIFTVDYESLVQEPEPILRRLIDFLDLDWDQRCLTFNEGPALVKTASIWQVREGLQQSSSGRWKNYQEMLPELARLANMAEE